MNFLVGKTDLGECLPEGKERERPLDIDKFFFGVPSFSFPSSLLLLVASSFLPASAEVSCLERILKCINHKIFYLCGSI